MDRQGPLYHPRLWAALAEEVSVVIQCRTNPLRGSLACRPGMNSSPGRLLHIPGVFMTYTPPLPGLSSEISQKYLAQTLGHIWRRFNTTEKTESDYRDLWVGFRTLNLFSTVACDGKEGVFSSRVCGNELASVHWFIMKEIGFDPWKEWSGR